MSWSNYLHDEKMWRIPTKQQIWNVSGAFAWRLFLPWWLQGNAAASHPSLSVPTASLPAPTPYQGKVTENY